jgi:hypothetical protein
MGLPENRARFSGRFLKEKRKEAFLLLHML